MATKAGSQVREENARLMTFLPVTLREQVEQLAKRDAVSVSAIARQAIKQFVEKQKAG